MRLSIIAASLLALAAVAGCVTCPLCGKPYNDANCANDSRRFSRIGELEGSVTYAERTALHPLAEVEVKLWKVSTFDGTPELVAETVVKKPKQVPVPFTIAIPPNTVELEEDYAVTARITVPGAVLFQTFGDIRVLTKGKPSVVNLVVARRVNGVTDSNE